MGMSKDWKPGFAKRVETTSAVETATVVRYTPEIVEAATHYYGHEPNGAELKFFVEERLT